MEKETYRDSEYHQLASLASYYRRLNAKQNYLRLNIDSSTQTDKVQTLEVYTQTGTKLDIDKGFESIRSTTYFGEPVFTDPIPVSEPTNIRTFKSSLSFENHNENVAGDAYIFDDKCAVFKQESILNHTKKENKSIFFDDDDDHKEVDEVSKGPSSYAGKEETSKSISLLSIEDFNIDDNSLREIEEQVKREHLRLVERGIMPDLDLTSSLMQQ
mmetsp:Transcript_25842/g.31735  ORF Transcript_25842/g.31735 Transcript_25842/m.31735 type:complete len:214 (+) Transcript_25842:271-912(+)